MTATVSFSPVLRRHVDLPPQQVPGATVRDVLEAVFEGTPRARSYVFDDRGALRIHVVVFVDGEQIADRERQSDPVPEGAEIWVMQALSGG